MPNVDYSALAASYDVEAARAAFPIKTLSVTPAGEGHKVLSFGIPSYNAAKDMDHCISSILEGSKCASDIEIIIVNDGSKDETGAKADEWEARYPGIVRVVHQENGGHGMAVRAGLREARGTYYKVVDSDDWLDADALATMLQLLRGFEERDLRVDLFISNYVYEKVHEGTHTTISYRMALPRKKVFTWGDIGRFRPDQNLLMHSVMYRTEVLRECGMVLPKHTFYVDNIFVYQPLPYVKSMYYMDLDLYRYFIGRADQSVNESVMVGRVDQQLRVTRHMIDCQDLDALKDQKRLRAYMVHYLSVMMAVSDIFLLLDGSAEAHAKKAELWQYLKDHVTPGVYRAVRVNLGGLTDLHFPGGDKVVVATYRQLRKIFKFN